ncbi:MAG: chemotaxis protein CheA [Gemmatimonadota bacterium]|nr:chemotaxis protein CheA [Gemmatimonadota bacterium]
MDLSQYAELFRTETRDHLLTFNRLLLEWEQHPDQPEPVAGIFRAVHTIKGMAATMGYARVADLAHRAETLLDRFRQGHRAVTDEELELLFRTADALEALVEASVGGRDAAVDVELLLGALDDAAGAHAAEPTARPRRISFVAAPVGVGRRIEVILRTDSPLKGARAALVLQRMAALGTVLAVEPAPAAIESDAFDGRFAFRLDATADAATIEREIRSAGDVDRIGIDAGDAVAEGDRDAGRTRHLRVDLRRLDTLMNVVGELVTARGRLEHLAAARGDAALAEDVATLSALTQRIQTEILQARMTPVWQVFDRFPRLVRDLSRQLNKQVAFKVEGKEIELDRAVLDEIGDPLVHLLRNAVDHGIEPPEERAAAGKPAAGQIVLAALRDRGAVTIVVSDDGRGLDRAKILAEAKARGVVDGSTDEVTDDLVLRVLGRSGFSTAGQVSQVSGRGVGVDVVLTRMRELGGSVEIKSTPGVGTTFTLRLPPTLAIVPALLARVGHERYALPLTHVAETVELDAGRVTRLETRDALLLRDELLPLVHLRDVLQIEGEPPRRRPVVVLQLGDRRTGLVIDRMEGQREIVVKSFRPPRGTLPIFSGATVLGDGDPVLILDAGGFA